MKKTSYAILVAMLVFAIGFLNAQEKQLSKQDVSLNALENVSLTLGTELSVVKNDDGSVSVLSGKLSSPIPVVKYARVASNEFLAENKDAFKINNVDEELALVSEVVDGFGMEHIKYNQMHNGVPVYRRTMSVHIDKERSIHAVTSNFIPGLAISVNPGLGENAAIQAVKSEKQFGNMPWEKASLIIHYNDMTGEATLAYAVHISNLRYNKIHFIDANNGRLIAEQELVHAGSVTGTGTNALGGTVNPLYTYTGTDYPYPQQWAAYMNPTNGTCQRGTYNMIDVSNSTIGNVYGLCSEKTNLSTINWIHSASSTFGTTADGTISVSEQRAAVSAAYNFRSTLNYFKNKHNRNGIDNAGMAVVHITNWYDPNDPVNAFWSGDPWNYMAFSNAEGSTTYNPLSCAIDVVAHELAHGITDKTSQLAYQNHSGALNESWSDVMGWQVEYYATGSADWLLGEDIYKSGTNAFRSFSTPTSYSQPDKVGGTYYVAPTTNPNNTNDYGGVHINSGIPNKVFHLLVAGGTHYGVTVTPFSATLSTAADQVGALAYLINTGGYYTASTNFDQARTLWESACSALYPGDATKLLNVKRAWYSVNVGTNPDASTGSITVTAPNGAENWTVGTSRNITWTHTGTISNVRIEYSTNSGTNWITVVSSVSNSGSYAWTVPNTPSTTCRVRVSNAAATATNDISNANFTISATVTNSVTVTAPNGGESWTAGTSRNITWTSTGTIANVKIDYSTNGGSSWITVLSSTPNDGSQAWTVPSTASTTCRVRVSDAANSATNDISNANFTISAGMIYVTETTSANDAISTAQNVASIPAQITGKFTSTTDRWDYYKFPVAANQTISVTMTVPSSCDYDLYLKNSSGTNLKTGTLGTGKTESFTYTNGSTATTLYLAAYRYSGTSTTAYVMTVTLGSAGLLAGNGGETGKELPKETSLNGNYPNPFNPTTTIQYDIAKSGKVSLKVYNLLGQEVRTLVNEYQDEGNFRVVWDGRNNAGTAVSTGLYIYRLQVGDFVATRKMNLIK